MSAKRIFIIAAFSVAVVAVMLLTLFFAPGSRRHDVFTLPEPPPQPSQPPGGENNLENISRIELNADTVRDVVASLERPAEYSRKLNIESFWEGGSAAYIIDAAVSGGMEAFRVSGAVRPHAIILRDGYAYIRYDGDERFAALPLHRTNAADEYQMMITYEDVIALERGDIISAELQQDGAEQLIYARWQSGELGYVTAAWISVRLGLLVRAVQWDNDAMIYRMTAGECDFSEIDASVFAVDA